MKKGKQLNYYISIVMISMLLILAGCDILNPEEEVEEPVDQSELLVGRLAVAVFPGGAETIVVTAKDKDNNEELYTVSSQNPAVASVVQLGSNIKVTGVGVGLTNIILTSTSGLVQEIPTKVYDTRVLDVGELSITYATTFVLRWNDKGSGATISGSFAHPIPPAGFHALGSIAYGGDYHEPNGRYSVMVVKANNGSDALAHPTGFTMIWADRGSGAHSEGAMWMPIPPAGYKAMGMVINAGWGAPAISDVVCVREDLTISGKYGQGIWSDAGSGADADFYCWNIEPPVSEPHDNAYLTPGTFFGWGQYATPGIVHSDINVLKVELPLIVETPYADYVPTLKGYDPPPSTTVPIMAREMLVPGTILTDGAHQDKMWKINNSPFYRLERQVYYKLIYHNHNQTSAEQNNNVKITAGVTTTESESYWRETSVSVTAEAGVSIKAADFSVSTTVTHAMGYSSMTSVAELHSTAITSTINTMPGKAAALWQRFTRYVLKRHNGSSLEPVASWEFGIDSYVTDEYPNE